MSQSLTTCQYSDGYAMPRSIPLALRHVLTPDRSAVFLRVMPAGVPWWDRPPVSQEFMARCEQCWPQN